MLRELLFRLLQREPDLEVVGEATDPVDLLIAVVGTGPDVVIHTFPDPSEPPGICSHLFAESPELLVIGVAPDGATAATCRHMVGIRPMVNFGLEDVLAEIRSVAVLN